MAAPALFIVVLSFSNDKFIGFPPKTWGLDRYTSVFTSGTWLDPISLSLQVAALAALLALVLVVPAVLGMKRGMLPGAGLIEATAIAPMLFPIAAYAVAMYAVFAEAGLIGTFHGIVLSHAIHAVPLVVIVLSTALDRVRPELELAAMTMGASRARAWVGITLRLLTPAVLGGATLAFVSSFDEAVFITFLGGPGLVTLPKMIFDSVQYGVDPSITAIATILMVVTAGLMLGATQLRKDVR
ncbi:ABC transporter permease subunit [Planosporangium flavigriseum]|nr:ABC transporter permease subunit [Planosporangium flavigriseum]